MFDVFTSPKNDYTRRLLKCDPARISEKCRQLPTMSSPDQKRIEDKETRSKRIALDREPILDVRAFP